MKTLSCRCGDVTLRDLDDAIIRGYQGCVALCAAHLVAAGGSAALPITPRPPIHPIRLADLAGLALVAQEDERDGRPPR